MARSAAVGAGDFSSAASAPATPSIPHPTNTPPSAPFTSSSNQRSTFQRMWHRIPATFKRPRTLLLVTSIPLLTSLYLSNPHHPLHQRIDALIAPLHSTLFTYQHQHNQRRLFQHLRGDTLDLTPHNTHNLTTLPQHVVYSAIVSNPYIIARLGETAERSGYPAGVMAVGCGDASVEVRKVASDSKDAVIASLLCSTKQHETEWQSLLRDCHRILKPGGKLYLIDYTSQQYASHPVTSTLQRLLSPLTRLLMQNSSFHTPVAAYVLSQTDEWDSVSLERWPAHGAAVPLTLSAQSEGGGVRVQGLGDGVAVVVGGVCVKRKAARLSEYVRGRENVLDELFKYGTFNSTRQSQQQQQQFQRK